MSHPIDDILARLHKAKPGDAIMPGYSPRDPFTHGKEVLVAELPATPDGYVVRVFETRLPARFYRVEALPTPDSLGRPRPGFEIETGSGHEMGILAGRIALEIANGMLEIRGTKS